jgi:hypothetical protein
MEKTKLQSMCNKTDLSCNSRVTHLQLRKSNLQLHCNPYVSGFFFNLQHMFNSQNKKSRCKSNGFKTNERGVLEKPLS